MLLQRQKNLKHYKNHKSQHPDTQSSRGHTETKLLQHLFNKTHKNIQDSDIAVPAMGFSHGGSTFSNINIEENKTIYTHTLSRTQE